MPYSIRPTPNSFSEIASVCLVLLQILKPEPCIVKSHGWFDAIAWRKAGNAYVKSGIAERHKALHPYEEKLIQ
jgi:hypothetical protein